MNIEDNKFDDTETYYKIPLRNKQQEIIEYALVDKDDYKNVSKYKWSCFIVKQKLDNKKYYRIKKTTNNISISLSHFIHGKPQKGYVIDHINNTSLDNRKANLQECTKAQNAQNREKMSHGVESKYIGVYKSDKKWRTRCAGTNLGTFDKEIDAATIYDKFALVKYGKNAQTNSLVKYEEIKDLSLEDIIPTKEKVGDNLPRFISLTKNSKYLVRITYNKKYFGCRVQTLDEAIKKLKEYENKVEKIKEIERISHYNKVLTKNDKGQAIINLYNKKKELIGNTIVDDDKWHDLSLFGWYLFENYARGIVNGKHIFLHRYLMNLTEEDIEKDYIVDHINGVPYDNRIVNLQITTKSHNGQNKDKIILETSTSQYKGVSYINSKKKYFSLITKNSINYNLGYFDEEIIAAIAYNLKAIELFGKNANINKLNINENLYEEYKKFIVDIWNKPKININKPKIAIGNKPKNDIGNKPKKYNGATLRKNGNYTAKIQQNMKVISLGTYDLQIKALIAYNIKLIEINGNLSKLNDINFNLYDEYKDEICKKISITTENYVQYRNKILH